MLRKMYPALLANYAMSFNWHLKSDQLTIVYFRNIWYSSMGIVVINLKLAVLYYMQEKNIQSTIKKTFISLSFIELVSVRIHLQLQPNKSSIAACLAWAVTKLVFRAFFLEDCNIFDLLSTLLYFLFSQLRTSTTGCCTLLRLNSIDCTWNKLIWFLS